MTFHSSHRLIALAGFSAILYGVMAGAGDLRERPALLLACFAAQTVALFAALRVVGDSGRGLPVALGAALLFRLVAAFGEPSLSDDVYRYVWDGRVQLEGVQPYRYAPDDPALETLRDDGWERINHREIGTIYPPLAQMLFAALAWTGLGVVGFKIMFGLLDFAVVLALDRWLRARGLPRRRVVLYAWCPLAVMETAGSGHVDVVGVLLLVLAVGLMERGRLSASAASLGAAVMAKLLPIVLLPLWVVRSRPVPVLVLLATLVVLAAPYFLTGPPVPPGTTVYAEHWDASSAIFPALRAGLRAAGNDDPGRLARGILAFAALGWSVAIAIRYRHGADVARPTFLVLAGALLLSPTLHPWYLLWVLPFAAAYRSRGFLALCFLMPLVYLGGGAILAAVYVPTAALLAWDGLVRRG